MKKLAKMATPMLIMALILICTAVPVLAGGVNSIDLVVDYEQNMFMAKYDVDVYLDDVYQDTIVHGDENTVKLTRVSSGQHTLKFCKSGAKTIFGSKTFTVNADSRIECRIQSHMQYIDIKTFQIYGKNTGTADTSKTSSFTVEITYEPNLIMAIYDVDMYIDDEFAGTLEQGKVTSGTLEISNGNHTITFCKSGSKSINGSTKLTVTGDTEFSCTLKAHTQYVEVYDIVTNASK